MSTPFILGYRRPVSTVTPFTYHDGDTFLKRLERLAKWLNELTEFVNTLPDSIDAMELAIEAMKAEIVQNLIESKKYTDKEINELRKELTALIDLATAGGMVANPVNGTLSDTITDALSDVYDNARVHAFSARYYDNLSLTAADFEVRDWTAREFDLFPLSPVDTYI